MFDPLPTPSEMARWDRATMREFGIKPEILMENAGREALAMLKHEFDDLEGLSATLFAGPGNNGGDAFVLARHLYEHGADVTVLHAKPKNQYRAEAAYHLRLAVKTGVPMRYLPRCNPDRLGYTDIIVDGLLGTGIKGDLKDDYLGWVRLINELGNMSHVLALDIPSGLNGETGHPSPEAVLADATVTFGAVKLGLVMPGADEFTGRLVVGRIGIPGQVIANDPPTHYLLTGRILNDLPMPTPEMHKGTAGHVLIAGGSMGLTGAPLLAAVSALRAGAGLATVTCPGGLVSRITQGFPDVMTLPISDATYWDMGSYKAIANQLTRFDAVILGPGLGRMSGARDFVRAYVSKPHPPTVFDADALYWLARSKKLLERLSPNDVITPHPGEMARLTGKSTAEVQADRSNLARQTAEKYQVTVVLKGAATVIASPGEPLYVSPFCEPNLAVGGTGDALSGITGSLLARGIKPLPAARIAVYWHGLCGQALRREYPMRGNLAQEVAHKLPLVLKEQMNA